MQVLKASPSVQSFPSHQSAMKPCGHLTRPNRTPIPASPSPSVSPSNTKTVPPAAGAAERSRPAPRPVSMGKGDEAAAEKIAAF
mmetsp:Transcript_1228/g.2764  ORF Transcript_1228/g.2764 Transcript_1228/m.2764 type:complete len:84 (+) Transcript_1228:149-400(+)